MDAKGLLGRMVCACDPVNKQLKTATFPSADVVHALETAAGYSHHTLIDAIWGHTHCWPALHRPSEGSLGPKKAVPCSCFSAFRAASSIALTYFVMAVSLSRGSNPA